MSARRSTNSVRSLLTQLLSRKRADRRRPKSASHRRRTSLQLEGLEAREMFAVTAIGLNGYGVLQVHTDNNATTVNVSKVGNNYRVTDVSTSRSWDYAASSVGRLDFVGGNGNDRFVNYAQNLPVRAWGQGGNDYLEGYDAVDYLIGGEGNDMLVGYGGGDQMWGGGGNDLIRGGNGVDSIWGEGGSDHLEGGNDVDYMWGGDLDDVLLGGAGDDQLVGDNGNDQLNGQAGFDRMWGVEGDDVLISVDGIFNEYVDGGNGSDVLWIDSVNNTFERGSDSAPGLTSLDTLQQVGAFSNGADRTLDGDNIADPSDIGTKLRYTNNITIDTIKGSNPLFAGAGFGMTSAGTFYPIPAGPRATDVVQSGSLGNCWITASVSAIAHWNPEVLTRNVVDFNDGTYGVRLGNSFYRVDNELAVKSTTSGATSDNLKHAKLGAQNSMWVAVVEKAFAAYRTYEGTYEGLTKGFEDDTFRAFRMNDANGYKLKSIYGSATYMANDFYNRWMNGYSMTIGVKSNADRGHAFAITGFTRDAAGAISGVVLRNPWGYDGIDKFNVFAGAASGSSTTDGTFTVSIHQLFNSGGWVSWAWG